MEAHTFDLKTPYLKEGRSHKILAQTDLMSVAIKYYNEGGENTLLRGKVLGVMTKGASSDHAATALLRQQGMKAGQEKFFICPRR